VRFTPASIYGNYFTGPVEHDPLIWIIGLVVLGGLLYALTKIGWPEI
jgi:hypothetical protein